MQACVQKFNFQEVRACLFSCPRLFAHCRIGSIISYLLSTGCKEELGLNNHPLLPLYRNIAYKVAKCLTHMQILLWYQMTIPWDLDNMKITIFLQAYSTDLWEYPILLHSSKNTMIILP